MIHHPHSRPISLATNPSVGTLQRSITPSWRRTTSKVRTPLLRVRQGKRGTISSDSSSISSSKTPQATVHVVRSGPLNPPREGSLPVPHPQHRSRLVSAGVTASNIRITPPPSSASSSPSVGHYGVSGGPAMPLRKQFAICDSPASSAGETSSHMPPTPRDESELGAGPSRLQKRSSTGSSVGGR